MALVALFTSVLLALALPTLWPQALGLDAHPPDLWVVVVAYLAFGGRGYTAVGWGILLGFVRDALSLDPLGTHAFVLGCVAFFFCEGQRHRSGLTGAPRVLATLAAALAAGWLYVLRTLPYGDSAAHASDFLHAVPTALFTGLFAAGLYPILDSLHVFDDLLGRTRGLPT